MRTQEEDAAIQADAYIDALLARPRLAAQPVAGRAPADSMRRAAELLAGLPRFHPSFAFEEALASRLRQLAAPAPASSGRLAEVIAFPLDRSIGLRGAGRTAAMPPIDRRLIVGGAIASGFSVAALYAWWHAARRGRPQVVA